MKQYIVQTSSQRFGPISSSQVELLVARGQVTVDDEITELDENRASKPRAIQSIPRLREIADQYSATSAGSKDSPSAAPSAVAATPPTEVLTEPAPTGGKAPGRRVAVLVVAAAVVTLLSLAVVGAWHKRSVAIANRTPVEVRISAFVDMKSGEREPAAGEAVLVLPTHMKGMELFLSTQLGLAIDDELPESITREFKRLGEAIAAEMETATPKNPALSETERQMQVIQQKIPTAKWLTLIYQSVVGSEMHPPSSRTLSSSERKRLAIARESWARTRSSWLEALDKVARKDAVATVLLGADGTGSVSLLPGEYVIVVSIARNSSRAGWIVPVTVKAQERLQLGPDNRAW